MPNYAIVVGIDRYDSPSLNLAGAVADATAMANWLLSPSGGNVAPARLFLFLSPVPDGLVPGLDPQPTTPVQLANRRNLVTVLRDIVQKAADEADRLYFSFAGHGVTAPTDLVDDAILPCDFTEVDTTVAIGLRSVEQWLQTARFNQQFLFIDGCRNIPYDGRFTIGAFPWVPDPAALRPQVEQFVFKATSRGMKSIEAARVTGVNARAGVFTTALLEGLSGAGSAKVYNVAEKKYYVTADRLLSYVVRRVRSQIAALQLPGVEGFLQTPTLSGERYSNPPLVELSPSAVRDVTLTVEVSPNVACPTATLTVERDQPVQTRHPVQAREVLSLPPKEYRLSVESPAFVPTQPLWKLDLYADDEVKVAMTPASSGGGRPGRAGETRRASLSGATRASLVVTTPDSLSRLEVENDRGEIVVTGTGRVESALPAGVYRARLRSPEGEVVEEMVSLGAGEEEEVSLRPAPAAAGGAFLDTVYRAGFQPQPDRTIVLSETSGIGPVADPRLSTILAVAAAVAPIDAGRMPAYHVRSLGLDGASEVRHDSSALQVFFGDEMEGQPHSFADVDVACWPTNRPAPPPGHPAPSPQNPALAQFVMPGRPGSYWLTLRWADVPAIALPVYLGPGRVTSFVVTRGSSRGLQINQFQPPLNAAPELVLRLQRRVDLAQRFLANGQYAMAADLVVSEEGGPEQHEEKLLLAKYEDAIAGLLGAYLTLRLREAGRLKKDEWKARLLETARRNLIGGFSYFSDVHVLDGALHLLDEEGPAAGRAFAKALDRGVPTFADGLLRLAAGIKKTGVQHAGAPLLERILEARLPGVIWTAFPASLLG